MFPSHADLFQDRKHDKFTSAGENATVEEFVAAAYLWVEQGGCAVIQDGAVGTYPTRNEWRAVHGP
jgi:hypothetical protein